MHLLCQVKFLVFCEVRPKTIRYPFLGLLGYISAKFPAPLMGSVSQAEWITAV
jgi:hypothetical protein